MRRWLGVLAVLAACLPAAGARAQEWHWVPRPIDPAQQTLLGFCDRSHWLQPWRAYLDTPPASALRRAAGINLNVAPQQLAETARLLAGAGFTRARIELGWDRMDYDRPGRLEHRRAIIAGLRVLDRAGLRPLILLNANSTAPGPIRRREVRLLAPALPGARTLEIDGASAAAVVPGRSGLVLGDIANAVVFTAVRGTRVTLSKPLPAALLPGPHQMTTLRHAPFGAPTSAAFADTLRGWLAYARAITRAARRAVGPRFDLEVWNEQTFGAEFLDARNYYDPLPATFAGEGIATDVILRRTVANLRRPGLAGPGVGITDGFASQTPFPSRATAPTGLTALSKHPYSGPRQVLGQQPHEAPCRPLGPGGALTGTALGGDRWRDAFTPRYVSYFPEYYLTAIQTEHYVRDLSPLTTTAREVPHGRRTGPAALWITETNMDPEQAGLQGAAARRMQAKAALRTLVAFVGKGVQALYFYSARGERFGLVESRFFAAGGTGGPAIEALGRLLRALPARRITTPRRLRLLGVADRGRHAQFAGDGTAAHPALWDRDVTLVQPFQVSDHAFAVAAYVMTRDVERDLAPAPFRLALGGVDGRRVRVRAYDPLLDRRTPARVVGRTRGSVTVQLALTDAPRLLRVRERAVRP